MLYPLSYEGQPAALPSPEPTALALGRVMHGCRRGKCLMVLIGRESGGDPVIDRALLSVDAVGVDLQQYRHVVTEPPGDLGGGDAVVQPERGAACRKS